MQKPSTLGEYRNKGYKRKYIFGWWSSNVLEFVKYCTQITGDEMYIRP